MKRTHRIVLLCAAATLASPGAMAAGARDYQPSFHPEQLKGPPAGATNDVLVLGTAHLSELKGFRPELLAPLIDRLAAWRPTVITTENVSGMQCDGLRRFPGRYAETVSSYCVDTKPAERATGLDVPAATAEAERLLSAWPVTPTPVDRRHLAAVFLAGGEPASALVQWLHLPESERRAGDGLDETLVALLEKLKDKKNETYVLAVPLAVRLGQQRVWSVDDHSADTPEPADPAEAKAASDAISHAWDNPALHARLADDAKLKAGLTQPGGMLAMYRAYNAPTQALRVFQSDFGAALAEPSQQGYGRGYVAYWETRNLRMVANIRDVIGRAPGTRLLAIVGASHKGYFEAYLNQMHDVRLVDAGPILK